MYKIGGEDTNLPSKVAYDLLEAYSILNKTNMEDVDRSIQEKDVTIGAVARSVIGASAMTLVKAMRAGLPDNEDLKELSEQLLKIDSLMEEDDTVSDENFPEVVETALNAFEAGGRVRRRLRK